MLVATKPKRRNRLALPRSKPSAQASTSGRVSQRSSEDESVIVTTGASSRYFPASIPQPSQTKQPGEQLCSSSGHPGRSCSSSEGGDTSSGDAFIGNTSTLCGASYETITERQTAYSLDKKSKRTQCVDEDPPATRSINRDTAAKTGKDSNAKAESRSTRVPFQTVQHNAQPAVETIAASESTGQQKARNRLTNDMPTGDGSRVRRNNSKDDKPPADVQGRKRESQPNDPSISPKHKSGENTQRLGPSGSVSERLFPATSLPKPETTRNHITPLRATNSSSYYRSKMEADTHSSCAVSTGVVEKLGDESIGRCKVSTLANDDTAPTPADAAARTDEAASTREEGSDPTTTHTIGKDGKTGGAKVVGSGSGQRCPVCCAAVWGLTVRARQVHINSCLDGNLSSLTRAKESVGAATTRSKGAADDAAAEGRGERPGASSSRTSGLTKEPKTGFQADIQMAKALSKSLLVVSTPKGVGDGGDEEPQDKEELVRNPVAFRAREKKLLARLKELDQKLERLQKDRENALKNLSAHRALRARVCADSSTPEGRVRYEGGEEHGVASKTAAEVVNVLFSDRGRVQPMGEGTRRGEKRKAVSAGRSVVQGKHADGDAISSPKAEDNSAAGEPRLLRRRSSGGGGDGRLSSLGGNTLWGIAQNADELSQSRFVTGVFADVRAEDEKERSSGLREGSDASGAQTATVTASAYGDPSLYNRRTSGTGGPGSADFDNIEVHGVNDSVDANSKFDAEGGKRRCGNDDRGAERDSAFSGGTETAADGAILLLTQTLSGQCAVSSRPRIEDIGANSRISSSGVDADADACAAERIVLEDAEKITARHIARAPVAAVSRFFPDWEENVRFVFQQGAPELRNALESISAALVKEEETKAARETGENAMYGEGAGKIGVDGGEVTPMAERERTGKVEALMFFEGIILDALDLKSPNGALEASITSVSCSRDLPDEGVSSVGSCREDVGEAGEPCDEGVPEGVCGGVEDHFGRDDDSNSSVFRRSRRNLLSDGRNRGNAVKDGWAVENWGSRGLVDRRCREVENDSRCGGGKQSTPSSAARSPNTSKGTESGDSPSCSRDVIVTLDLTTPGKHVNDSTTADAASIASPSFKPTDGNYEEGNGMDFGDADTEKDEEDSITGFELFWEDPLGFPSPCDGVSDDALPLPTRSSPQAKHQQTVVPTALNDGDSREEELRSFDLTGALSTVSSRPISAVGHYGHRKSPSSIQLDSPERLDARPTMTILEDSERRAGEDERRTEEEEEEKEAEVMPPFEKMTQQELTGMMSVYGLKKRSRRDMVERLKHIWKALHPTVTARAPAGGREDGRVSPMPAVASDGVSTPAPGGCAAFLTSSQGRSRGLAKAVPAKASGRPPLAGPRAALASVDENDARRDERLPRCSASRQRAEGKGKEALGEQIRAVVTGNAQLHEDILLLRTLELTATQVLLKDAGVKCSKRDLASFLDDKGITFVDRGTGARAAKKSKRKGRLTGGEEGDSAVSKRYG